MPSSLYIPREVKAAIREHLIHAVEDAREDYWSVFADEDALTGHFLKSLSAKNRKVPVTEGELRGVWTWSISYHKFRGDGPGAPESTLGADGMFIMRVDYGGRIDEKVAIFQAKIEGKADRELVSQCIRLSTWREAAFVLNFSPERFEAIRLDEVLRAAKAANRSLQGKQLGEFLADDFISCLVGDTNIAFDARKQVLRWRAMDGEFVSTRFKIGKRVSFDIRAPKWIQENLGSSQEVDNSDVHLYRMYVEPLDMLEMPYGSPNAAVSKKRRELAAAYHTDGRIDLNELDLLILKRRLQEINHAADVASGKSTPKRRARPA